METLEVVRALAALSVVGFHSRALPIERGFESGLPSFLDFGKLGVPVFFVLSGFIILYIHGKDLGECDRCPRYFFRRWVRIWPIYAALTILQFAGKFVIPGYASDSFSQLLTSLLFLDLEETPIITVGWTLVHEAFFYLVFGFLIIFKVRFAACFLMVFVVALVGYHLDPAEGNALVSFVFDNMRWYFLAGIAVACLSPGSSTGLPPASSFFGIGAFILMALLGLVGFFLPNVGKINEVPLFLAVGIGVVLLALVRWDLGHRPRMPRLLVYLGAASYSIYLVHGTVLDIGFKVSLSISPEFHKGYLGMIMLFVGLISVVSGILCHELLEKPMINRIKKQFKAEPSSK